MFFLSLKAYVSLLALEPYLLSKNFAGLRNKVTTCPLKTSTQDERTLERISEAVNLACVWYWKRVLCLQRSAVTVCLLKQHGLSAQMVIGAQSVPFRAHAWVEFAGRVVNDKGNLRETYTVLDYC